MTKPADKPKSHLSRDGRYITVHISFTFRQRSGRKQIISPTGASPWSPAPRVDAALIKAIVRAYRWREMLETGEYGSAADLAKAEKVNASYLSRILRLTLLAPEIVEVIIAGQQPSTLQVDDLLRPLPAQWPQQKSILCGPAPAPGL
jgi:hypothetical protein